MSIRVAIRHQTRYAYDRPVGLSPHVFRLKPAPHCRTPIRAYSFTLRPEEHFINWQQDAFANHVARVVFPEKTCELAIDVEVIADLTVINPFDFFLDARAETCPFSYEAHEKKDLAPYLEIAEQGPLLKKWLSGIRRDKQGTVDFLVAINHRMWQDVAYAVRMEPGVQSCEETLGKALGSCRDSGWLLVQILRHLGLAARFVSGYLVQLAPDEKALDGPPGPDKDFTDLHAWAEVYVPGAGWLGLDPTSGLFAGEGHIPLACTPDPFGAAPVSGATELCQTDFFFQNTVERIREDPRVTRPYTDAQWAAIDALGRKVDADLSACDVRLTMGGEPTFVGIDDVDDPEWNTRADGPRKRARAVHLIARLHRAFAPGGLLHYGQGKQYPGELLPRWNYTCLWRKDGAPVWQTPALMRHPLQEGACTLSDAGRFAAELAGRLGLAPDSAIPGYEDVAYHLWEEGNLPLDIDPHRADIKDPIERQMLARALERGLDQPVGYALPLRWDFRKNTWQTSCWRFRRKHMYLLPGASPMGYRLPLSSLEKGDSEPEIWPQPSLFVAQPPLGDFTKLRPVPKAALSDPDAPIVRTALCVEIRNGNLCIFLPPVSHIEHALRLIAAVEATAGALALPVLIEGYEPPPDNRIERLSVSPDPGILEVNVHPASTWADLVDRTATLYEEARQVRLSAEKFMIDGRHTGTGGGNHITIGGPTPGDSPILRRPDLLRSLVAHWQRHPGLSYLFSGMFIGPTSQAPRVDEGREEALYELEVAFQQMPEGQTDRPWLVDRLLRHLLVDITGNTHRAEFCIDKLYSPDSERGRLGLVELRAFEMPPHPRMSLVQALLVRTLIARFWQEPARGDLVRWGTELHDRFMLPHFVCADLKDVVADLQDAGYPFQMAWLDPFFEFRFPRYGEVVIGDIHIELRQAIEPWHVLGEEVTRAGTARFVDSSVERLQIKLTGLVENRYAITCNGRRVPLRCTGAHGQWVAGVRYRAWQPPSALHPTIGVHSPLVFDVIDMWNGRSIGGCTYHVMHPGGRNYETLPVNAYEAEARRAIRFREEGHTPGPIQPPPGLAALGRFFPEGHPPGPMRPPEEDTDPEYPCTLDLRKRPRHIS